MSKSYNSMPAAKPMAIWPLLIFALLVTGLILFSKYNFSQSVDSDYVLVGNHKLTVKIAKSNDEKQKGLMGVKSLPANHGMLFVFEKSQPLAFWMKDTLIPLDIIFFDEDNKLINIHHQVQPCPPQVNNCPTYSSERPAKYVVELSAGEARRLSLEPGNTIQIPQY